MPPTPSAPPRVEARLLPPRRRLDLPEWAIWVDGHVAGWVQQRHLRGAARPFYGAYLRHPTTGKIYNLNVSTDREERIDGVVAAWFDPTSHKGHEVISKD